MWLEAVHVRVFEKWAAVAERCCYRENRVNTPVMTCYYMMTMMMHDDDRNVMNDDDEVLPMK